MIMSSEKLQEIMADAEQQKNKETARPSTYDPVDALKRSLENNQLKQQEQIAALKSKPAPVKQNTTPQHAHSPVAANMTNKEQIATDKANADVDELFVSMQASQAYSNSNRYLYFIAAVTVVLAIATAGVMLLT